MIQFLFLLLSDPEAERLQAQQDSVIIYNVYKENIEVLKTMSSPEQWYAYTDSLTGKVACAMHRLSQYNDKSYKPEATFNREGFGEAYSFPVPSLLVKKESSPKAEKPVEVKKGEPKPVTVPEAPAREIAFKILDSQTHFLISNEGKTKTPYITMNYYAKGRILVKSEKLNPITMKPIDESKPATAMINNGTKPLEP